MTQTDQLPDLREELERVQVEEPDTYADILRNFDALFSLLSEE